jgi:hypothetical protein
MQAHPNFRLAAVWTDHEEGVPSVDLRDALTLTHTKRVSRIGFHPTYLDDWVLLVIAVTLLDTRNLLSNWNVLRYHARPVDLGPIRLHHGPIQIRGRRANVSDLVPGVVVPWVDLNAPAVWIGHHLD